MQNSRSALTAAAAIAMMMASSSPALGAAVRDLSPTPPRWRRQEHRHETEQDRAIAEHNAEVDRRKAEKKAAKRAAKAAAAGIDWN